MKPDLDSNYCLRLDYLKPLHISEEAPGVILCPTLTNLTSNNIIAVQTNNKHKTNYGFPPYDQMTMEFITVIHKTNCVKVF